MLIYDNQSGPGPSPNAVAKATVALALVALVNVASEMDLSLDQAALDAFTVKVQEVIDNPDVEVTPGDLVRHSEGFVARWAQSTLASGATALQAPDSDSKVWPPG